MYELWCTMNYSGNWLSFQLCLLLNGLAEMVVALTLLGLFCAAMWWLCTRSYDGD